MDQHLRGIFERALDTEPEPPAPGQLAQEAIALGTRLRRRRHLLTGGAACVIAAFVTALTLSWTASADQPAPSVQGRAGMMAANPDPCAPPPGWELSDVSIFLLPEVADPPRRDLYTRLQSDPRVKAVEFQSREDAYAKFVRLWKHDPDLVAQVTSDQLSESFNVNLVNPPKSKTFAEELGSRPGVDVAFANLCEKESSFGVGR